ncbi:general secretion pathway protein GspH [Vibrio sp. MACH09]|uniref:pilus assembly FimT family protein n=1 Tax=Vibrio sp. MACH09 TaxID=3025122 RepID=UPI00278E356B|nr:prepilin-type N-terminal cleavage/methylation domain-containing protein [Vibrio sp. MACH09]GLO60121.1 general secretion pathway protein GspH [Vibrio sp. MACH09]
MRKGFTLLELVITLSVIAVLLYSAMPSWDQFVERFRLRSTASQLQGVFVVAKREAITRNEDIWLHISVHPLAGEYQWNITLSTHQEETKSTESESSGAIAVYEGKAVFISSNRSVVKLLGKNGKFSAAGHIEFSQNRSKQPSFKLIYHHITGRVRVCSVNGSYYGYSSC